MKVLRGRGRDRSNVWRIAVLALIALYFVQIDNLMKVRPDHAFLALLIVALVLGNAKRFLADWCPFLFLWIAYDFMRGIVDDIAGRIHILDPYAIELSLFGWLGGGQIPNFAMLDWRQQIAGTALREFLDASASAFYAMHMAAPLLLGWIFWHTLRDRPSYYRFILAFSITTWTSFATYFAYPAAPPWYVRDFGFIQPEPSFKGAGAGNLVAADRWIGIPLFESVYRHLNPNKFAAIPSLHSAFPLLIFVYAARRFGRRAWPLFLYPAGVWFSAVYLNHHYLIDILLAMGYVAVAVFLTNRILYPVFFERGVLRRLVIEPAPEADAAAGTGEARRAR
jgi:hypothetical protein